MNYIFIDIDGVLNSGKFLLKYIDEDIAIDDRPVKLLSELIHKYSAKIILSSSWRRHYTENGELRDGDYPKERDLYLIQTLYKYNIAISGRTRVGISKYGDPYDEGNRAEEIQEFIDKNLVEGDNYVIFDDEDFTGTLLTFGKHFIQTKWEKGLTKRNIKKAKKVFKHTV